jgi:hypothetical protein
VYGWLWRSFPGGVPGKLLCSLALLAGALALLFFVVFPRVEQLLPFQDVNVDTGPASSTSATPVTSPVGTPTPTP